MSGRKNTVSHRYICVVEWAVISVPHCTSTSIDQKPLNPADFNASFGWGRNFYFHYFMQSVMFLSLFLQERERETERESNYQARNKP